MKLLVGEEHRYLPQKIYRSIGTNVRLDDICERFDGFEHILFYFSGKVRDMEPIESQVTVPTASTPYKVAILATNCKKNANNSRRLDC